MTSFDTDGITLCHFVSSDQWWKKQPNLFFPLFCPSFLVLFLFLSKLRFLLLFFFYQAPHTYPPILSSALAPFFSSRRGRRLSPPPPKPSLGPFDIREPRG